MRLHWVRTFATVVALLCTVLVGPLAGQTLTSTTATSAIAVGDVAFPVASATGFVVGNVVVVDREAMRITAVTGTRVSVARGTDGTSATAHASGAVVYTGVPTLFGPLTKLHDAVLLRTGDFNIDNGAGVTHDAVFPLSRPAWVYGCTLTYGETAGTVAGANVRIGTTVGAQDVVAADAYTDSAAAGTIETLVLLRMAVPAGALYIRHTGIVAVAAGIVNVQCDVALQ